MLFCADWQPAPKVILLEFALVRCGSHADLACEEAPEICAHLEPLPSPRKDPQCKFSAVQDSDCIDIPWEEAVRACMRQQPMPAGVPGPLGIVIITDLASSQPRAMQHSHSMSGSLKLRGQYNTCSTLGLQPRFIMSRRQRKTCHCNGSNLA